MKTPAIARLAALPLLGLAFSTLAAGPLVVVHKNESCGCCNGWVSHMRKAGFEVEVRNVANMNPVKERVGVPAGKGSCHTAEVAGYFIEGHVPAVDVKRLLAERPEAKGITVTNHNPGFDIDEDALPVGVEMLVTVAERYLAL